MSTVTQLLIDGRVGASHLVWQHSGASGCFKDKTNYLARIPKGPKRKHSRVSSSLFPSSQKTGRCLQTTRKLAAKNSVARDQLRIKKIIMTPINAIAKLWFISAKMKKTGGCKIFSQKSLCTELISKLLSCELLPVIKWDGPPEIVRWCSNTLQYNTTHGFKLFYVLNASTGEVCKLTRSHPWYTQYQYRFSSLTRPTTDTMCSLLWHGHMWTNIKEDAHVRHTLHSRGWKRQFISFSITLRKGVYSLCDIL